MTEEPQAAPDKPLTVAEAATERDKAAAELSNADRALTAAYLATRQKKGLRKPKAVEMAP